MTYFVFFLLMLLPPPRSTLFPYTTLFRSEDQTLARLAVDHQLKVVADHVDVPVGDQPLAWVDGLEGAIREGAEIGPVDRDRKSTRLNSSHVAISYAVFCLKKKKKQKETIM